MLYIDAFKEDLNLHFVFTQHWEIWKGRLEGSTFRATNLIWKDNPPLLKDEAIQWNHFKIIEFYQNRSSSKYYDLFADEVVRDFSFWVNARYHSSNDEHSEQ